MGGVFSATQEELDLIGGGITAGLCRPRPLYTLINTPRLYKQVAIAFHIHEPIVFEAKCAQCDVSLHPQ